MTALTWLLWALLVCGAAEALDNGAADTPPLGWCSWQRYRCSRKCNSSTAPDCFNEKLIRDTADAMASNGLKEAGYEFVALDDCVSSRLLPGVIHQLFFFFSLSLLFDSPRLSSPAIIDGTPVHDQWQAPKRVNGRVVADPQLFPSGIKALAAYVHSKGLKFGLYTAIGEGTCAMGSDIGLGCDFTKIPACKICVWIPQGDAFDLERCVAAFTPMILFLC